VKITLPLMINHYSTAARDGVVLLRYADNVTGGESEGDLDVPFT
jgi:hypothetical protein